MVAYPRTEQDVVTLADAMISGYTQYPDDFPSGNPEAIQTTLNAFKQACDAQTAAELSTKTATEEKSGLLDSLNTMIKTSLKRAEADVAGHEDKLAEIGWGTKAPPQPLTPPSFPGNLHPIAEGNGMIWLSWDKPAGSGGDVWNYIVERRQQSEGQQCSEWTFAGQSYNCEINLTEQPIDVRLEYRVKASNTAGQSAPSNSVSVVLP